MSTPLTNLDGIMPRSAVLKFPDTVDYRRPNVVKGSIRYPAGVSVIQVAWAGDAALIVTSDTGTLAGAWQGAESYATKGRYPMMTLSAETEGILTIQGRNITSADLSRHVGITITPIGAV